MVLYAIVFVRVCEIDCTVFAIVATDTKLHKAVRCLSDAMQKNGSLAVRQEVR